MENYFLTPEQFELAHTVCGYFMGGCFLGSVLLHSGALLWSYYCNKKIDGLRQCLKELQVAIDEPEQVIEYA